MTELNLSEKILDKIKKNHIEPKAKWRFTAKNAAIWIVAMAALLFGGLASSVVVFMLVNNDWDVYEHISGSLPEFVFITMPYYWLVFLLIFILTANYYLKNTKKGYRYKLWQVATLIIFSSLSLGVLFYNVGMGKAIEEVFSRKVPFYSELSGQRKNIWEKADEGRMAGEIIMLIDEDEFRFREMNLREWRIMSGAAIMPPGLLIKEGDMLKIIGKKIDENNFEAFIIKPMGVPFGGMIESGRGIRRGLNEHPEIRERLRDIRFRPEMKGSMINPGLPRPSFERNSGELRNTIIEDSVVR
jgi:hypothetical protein